MAEASADSSDRGETGEPCQIHVSLPVYTLVGSIEGPRTETPYRGTVNLVKVEMGVNIDSPPLPFFTLFTELATAEGYAARVGISGKCDYLQLPDVTEFAVFLRRGIPSGFRWADGEARAVIDPYDGNAGRRFFYLSVPQLLAPIGPIQLTFPPG